MVVSFKCRHVCLRPKIFFLTNFLLCLSFFFFSQMPELCYACSTKNLRSYKCTKLSRISSKVWQLSLPEIARDLQPCSSWPTVLHASAVSLFGTSDSNTYMTHSECHQVYQKPINQSPIHFSQMSWRRDTSKTWRTVGQEEQGWKPVL